MGYYKIKSHAGTGKLLNIAASGPISGRKNTNIWDESCPIDQTWSIASLGNNQQVITSCKKYSPNVRLYHIQTALGEYFF